MPMTRTIVAPAGFVQVCAPGVLNTWTSTPPPPPPPPDEAAASSSIAAWTSDAVRPLVVLS